MRTIIYIAFTILVFSSCGINYADYDFGEFEFKDPFCGIEEEYRPEFLKKTLEYPPFSWFMEDSTYNEAFLFHVEFNEECVRDKSPVEFCITDKDGNVINCLSIECEGKVTHNGFFYVYPNSKEKDIEILVNAPFEIGDTTFVGTIAVSRFTVDEVNEVELTNSYESIGSFYFKHEISWNWPIVIMWLLCVLLVGYLIFLILKGLSLISCQIPVKISFNKIRNSINSGGKKRRKYKKEEKKDNNEENQDRELLAYEALQKMHTLYAKLVEGIDINARSYDLQILNERINKLPEPWRTIMANFNSSGETKKPNDSEGVWTFSSNSLAFWKPNRTLMPKGQGNDRNYNPNRWTLREFLRNTGKREYVCFNNGYPDFTPFAYMTFICDIPVKMETDRKKLHPYIINNILPNKMGGDVENVKQLLGDEKLTIHENVDGTFSLVHLSIHSSIPHNGGVSLCKILCSGPCMPTVLNSRFIN